MRHFLLHGLTVALETELPDATTAVLLGEWPAANDAPAVDLRLRVRVAEPDDAPSLDGWTQLFFHADVKGLFRDGRFLLVQGTSTLLIDGARLDVRIAPEELGDPAPFANGPLLIALAIALRLKGLYHLHAGGLVDASGRGIVVTGASGAGKSTLTLSLIASGFDYLGDDVLFVGRRGGEVRLFNWPRPFHVGDATARAFPALQGALGPRYSTMHNKRALDGASVFPGRAVAEMSAPGIVLFPGVEDRPDTVVEPLEAVEALGQLLHSSAMLAIDNVPGSADHLRLLGQMIDGARCFQVRLGRDLLDAPVECARRMLEACGFPGAT